MLKGVKKNMIYFNEGTSETFPKLAGILVVRIYSQPAKECHIVVLKCPDSSIVSFHDSGKNNVLSSPSMGVLFFLY